MSARIEIKQMMDEAEAAGTPLTAPQVVEAAKDAARWPNLNRHLWQVPEADLAMEARLARAHRLLITILVTTSEGITTRMFLHTEGVPGYQSLGVVAGNKDLAATKLLELTQDISRARARLRAFRSALPDDIGSEIDEALEAAEAKAAAAAAERTPQSTAA